MRILIKSGAKIIQLREKYLSPREFYEDAQKSIQVARSSKVKIIINDRVDIALALNSDGVHLGQDDICPKDARKMLGEKAIIGYSTHSVEQAIAADVFPIDYIAIGPVFATSTKENSDPTVGLEGVRNVRQAIRGIPLVAIGGINISNFDEVLENGADSVALISELLSNTPSIPNTMRKMLAKRL